MPAFSIDVNPQILKWAREEAGYSVDDVAGYLKTTPESIKEWEKEGTAVRYTYLSKIARYYKRQVAVFFLKDVPKRTNKPKDYRNLSKTDRTVSPEVMLAIRRTSRYLSVYRDMTDKSYISKQYEWLNIIRTKKDISSSEYLRELLGLSVDEQRLKKNQTFSSWRKKVEDNLGIFVFQFPIPNHQFDGFSYIEDGEPYGITINSKISENRKIFTIFHELGHIIEGSSGICFTTEAHSQPFSIEAKCNRLAAELLMPAELIEPVDTFEDLDDSSRKIGVSKEAYLIRLKELRRVSDNDFNKFMSIIREFNCLEVKSRKEMFRHQLNSTNLILRI